MKTVLEGQVLDRRGRPGKLQAKEKRRFVSGFLAFGIVGTRRQPLNSEH